jgi:hypothetical protein
MTEPSTSDTRRPSPRPRADATTTSTPIHWPTETPEIPAEPAVAHGRLTVGVQTALEAIEHLPCVGMCPGRQVDKRGEWCSFCTAKQALADALAEVGPAAVHVVHRGGELLHAALGVDAARVWAADAAQDGLTLTTLDVQ